MRPPLGLIIIGALTWAPVINAQTAAAARVNAERSNAPQATAPQAAAVPASSAATANGSQRAHLKRPRSRRSTDTAHSSQPAGGVLDLGATDITGNKELPKVMVIVPWKDSLGAGGVVKPTDSLLDEVLQPVDRGVFQRRVRYFGQLEAAGVAPVGDSH